MLQDLVMDQSNQENSWERKRVRNRSFEEGGTGIHNYLQKDCIGISSFLTLIFVGCIGWWVQAYRRRPKTMCYHQRSYTTIFSRSSMAKMGRRQKRCEAWSTMQSLGQLRAFTHGLPAQADSCGVNDFFYSCSAGCRLHVSVSLNGISGSKCSELRFITHKHFEAGTLFNQNYSFRLTESWRPNSLRQTFTRAHQKHSYQSSYSCKSMK